MGKLLKEDVDKIFKIGLLVLGFCYLAYLFCPVSHIGRYSKVGPYGILDTATAVEYTLNTSGVKKGNWTKHNPLTAKRELIEITGNLEGFGRQ